MAKKDKDGKKSKEDRRKQAPAAGALTSALTMAARSLRTALSRNLLQSGLYAGQDGVILALAEDDGMSPGTLAQRLGVKAPTMTRTIARLEAQGFVARSTDDGDGRAVRIRLTEAGRETVTRITDCISNAEAEAATSLDSKDQRQLVKLLRKLDANLSPSKTKEQARKAANLTDL